jgi:hypothetical protein
LKKISAKNIAGALSTSIVVVSMGIWFIFKFFNDLRFKQINEIEEINNVIIFKGNSKELFVLEKFSRYSVDISNNTIAFTYFGCALKNDCHKFRISRRISKRLKEVLIPSDFLYEQGLYRLR